MEVESEEEVLDVVPFVEGADDDADEDGGAAAAEAAVAGLNEQVASITVCPGSI